MNTSSAEGRPSADPDQELDPSACTVLLVDDHVQNLELLEAYLEPLGCAIRKASDGTEAMRLIEEEAPQPDLVILDVMMPRMSGFEVCRKLKEAPSTRSIPVMMVTALNEIGDLERGVDCGTDDFVSKPVNKLELVTRVKSLLRVRQLKSRLERTRENLERAQDKEELGEED
jgi:two-component system cell cycle response regulator